jgi:ABC-type multidrug transport system fused ATPase/permease subunit
MLELFVIVELKNRIAANEIWIKGSRTYRTLDEGTISHQTYAIIKAEARIPVAIPVDVEIYLAEKAEALDQKLREAANRLETGRGDTRIGAKGLRVPAVKIVETEAALAFARRVASSMPPIRLTDLVADVDRMTGFNSLFEHFKQVGRRATCAFPMQLSSLKPPILASRRWHWLALASHAASYSRWQSGTSGRKPSRWRSPGLISQRYERGAIPEGRITALIGANGSGKSTLLRTLGRVLDPLGGTVLLDGKDISTSPARPSRVSSLCCRKVRLLPTGW